MNFHISGKRDITVNKTGAVEVQLIHCELNQTPTTVTREILASADPVAAYKAWVMRNAVDKKEPVYAENDFFCEDEPIGYKTTNYAKESCIELDEWIAAITAIGYELEFYSL